MGFVDQLKNTLNESEYNTSVTENGALGYRSTGKALLDLNFAVSSLRDANPGTIIPMFLEAFGEDKELALKWLFFARDPRGGLGERRLFRIIMNHMAFNQPGEIMHLLPLIAEYGRWDDLIELYDIPTIKLLVKNLIMWRIMADSLMMKKGQHISLLAKWMPSVNTSSRETRNQARRIASGFGLNDRGYRKLISKLRAYLNVVETKTSSNKWSEINYEAVPSRANLLYSNAFLRHDADRRNYYLESVKQGKSKINAGVLYPHDIVYRYHRAEYQCDDTLEALWKALPNVVPENSSTIVVADGSGSMHTPVGNSGVLAINVANALAIYFAEKLNGEFKDRYITFSNTPRFVELSGGNTLAGKLMIAAKHAEVANTNIEAVFNLILQTALDGNMKQEELPSNVLIISDMEFDDAQFDFRNNNRMDERLFSVIRSKFEENGYKLPRLVFWNVNSRTGTIPVKENEFGVALVSGFSPNVATMVMSSELDPYKCLTDLLMSDRYLNITDRSKVNRDDLVNVYLKTFLELKESGIDFKFESLKDADELLSFLDMFE